MLKSRLIPKSKMLDKIKTYIVSHDLILPADSIVIGVSGGPDSVCLLNILNDLKEDLGVRIHIAHLNHKLRSKESDSDEEFVKSLAKKLNLPITVKSADIARLSKIEKLSIEDCARRQRYKFFISLASSIHANKLALAHTKDDLAETFLMRAIRGSGLAGLRGMLPKSKFEGLDVIRPLIGIDKKSILRYLKHKAVAYKIDSTNLSCDHLRNKIRLRLMPALETYNPNIKNVLADTAAGLADDFDYINNAAEAEFDKICQVKKDYIKINLARFSGCHISIFRLVLRQAIFRLKGDLKSITFRNSQAIEELIRSKKINEEVQLPGNIAVRKGTGSLTMYAIRKVSGEKPRLYKLNIPGKTRVDRLGVEFTASVVKPKSLIHKNRMYEYLDLDKIKQPVYVRTWMPADSFKPLGLGLRKKLHDFFIDEKVPFMERNGIPLLISKNNIVWIGGLRLSDDVKVDSSTKKVLKVLMSS